MQGQHSPIRDPVKTDQITASEEVVQDYDQSYTQSQLHALLRKYIPDLEVGEESIDVSSDSGIKSESLTYYYLRSNPNVKLLVRNVTYLGKPHPIFKKRIQIPPKWRIFASLHFNDDVRFIGVYHYNDLELIVDFEKDGFLDSKAKNASAHVMVFDLFQGYINGFFSKIDAFGHLISVIKPSGFLDYLKLGARKSDLSTYFGEINLEMPFNQEIIGIDAYKEMFDSGFPYAAEAEWPGFYVEFRFSEILRRLGLEDKIQYLGRKGKGEEALELDLFFGEESFYGDIKSSSISETTLYGNKIGTTDEAIEKYGKLWYIIYTFDSERDVNHGRVVSEWWSNKRNKERKSDGSFSYEKRMKYSIVLKEMYVIQIDKSNKHHLLREAEVSGNRMKYALKKKDIDNFVLYRYKLK